jgi:hypothetical protein
MNADTAYRILSMTVAEYQRARSERKAAMAKDDPRRATLTLTTAGVSAYMASLRERFPEAAARVRQDHTRDRLIRFCMKRPGALMAVHRAGGRYFTTARDLTQHGVPVNRGHLRNEYETAKALAVETRMSLTSLINSVETIAREKSGA